MKNIVTELKKRHLHIGVMESCTGGAIANEITNTPGSSDVFEEGLVTYSERSKIKYGVLQDTINMYGVFSNEVASEMAKCTNGDIGVGVSGELPGKVFVAVRIKNKITNKIILFKTPLSPHRRVSPLEKGRTPSRIKMKNKIVKIVFKMIFDLM